MQFRICHFFILSPLIAFTLGCSGEEIKLPVSGTVTVDGRPLADVNVMMIRDDGMNTMATTDASGRFSCGGNGEAEGLPAGTYKVGVSANTTIDSSEVVLAGSTKRLFALKFEDPDTSELSITVTKEMPPVEISLTEK